MKYKAKTLQETLVIRQNGYEYILVKRIAAIREIAKVEQPCFMGYEGFALNSTKKL